MIAAIRPRTEGTQPRAIKLALRLDEAAEALGVSARTLAEWTKAGEVPYIKRKRVLMYNVRALRRWLDAQTIEPTRNAESPPEP